MQFLVVEILYDLAYILRMLPGCDQQRVRRFYHNQVGDADGRDELSRGMNIISARI